MALYTVDDLMAKGQKITKSLSASASKILLDEFSKIDLDEKFDIFLSHSYLDANMILALKDDIESMGFKVYVDWVVDTQLSREDVTKQTADTLRKRMDNCRCLIYAASDNSELSKWMPWELGYFDAKKGKVAILPVSDTRTSDLPEYKGQEYLGLYYYVDKCPISGSEIPTLWVNEEALKYISFENWLKGGEPYLRNRGVR